MTNVCFVTSKPTQSSSRCLSATEHLSGELQKSEVLLIARTLLMVKAKNLYRNTSKMLKTMETELKSP